MKIEMKHLARSCFTVTKRRNASWRNAISVLRLRDLTFQLTNFTERFHLSDKAAVLIIWNGTESDKYEYES